MAFHQNWSCSFKGVTTFIWQLLMVLKRFQKKVLLKTNHFRNIRMLFSKPTKQKQKLKQLGLIVWRYLLRIFVQIKFSLTFFAF